MADDFSFRFWGVRGSIPTTGREMANFGGATACVEVQCGGRRLILDGGTGLSVMAHGLQWKQVDILLSHTHIDHVLGLPFFLPFCPKGMKVGLWAGPLLPEMGVKKALGQLMSNPLFPITPDELQCDMAYHDFSAGETLADAGWQEAGIGVQTFALAHPDRATGYRISYQGHSVCYITDYEHREGELEGGLVAFLRGADALIFDSTYTDEEFAQHRGWGHSTWQQGMRLADAAGVKQFFAFHHDPLANDMVLAQRDAELGRRRPGSCFAREGMQVKLWPDSGITQPVEAEQDAIKLVEQLTSIGMALSQQEDIDTLLEIILVEAQRIAGADGGTLYYRNARDELEFAIIRNNTLKLAYGGAAGGKAPFAALPLYDEKSHHPNQRTLAAYAVLHKKPVNIADAYAEEEFDFTGARLFDAQHGYRTQSVLAIPMISHRKEALGCLQLVNARDPETGTIIAFSPQVQRLVQSLASQAAIILDNKALIQGQKDLLESFIKMIAHAIDAKSPYTGAHCERVPALTNMLAEAACATREGAFASFSLTAEEKYELHIAGWMHDCGKVATPVHIMDKSTKLETIFDRIALVQARFELLKRDAKITLLEQAAKPGADQTALDIAYAKKVAQIDDDFAFIAKNNIGGEFMTDADLARLALIAEQCWDSAGLTQKALTAEELKNLSVRRGTLTDEERRVMNDHMVHTCAMLEALPFPRHLRRVPEYAGGHHERMDGKGYPKGIRAGDMSIPARMMAVADVFEALTAGDRPYKSAKKLSEAMAIIGQMKKQHHLDPVVVDFFITSQVYMDYARRYLAPELIDVVDEAALLAIQPQ
jgi:HD-GYP domain-containing protein (c-di-GMP phosphodiesterase class II)/phosphoribosyl 1,2-cyclic phosphodiesterase